MDVDPPMDVGFESDLFVDEPPLSPTEDCADSDVEMIEPQKVANPALSAKHLRSPNSTPLSSPSRDRTKRPKPAKNPFDSSEDEGELITFIQ
jgi:hypothetical protein